MAGERGAGCFLMAAPTDSTDPFEKSSRRSAARRHPSRRRDENRRTVFAVALVACLLVAGVVLIVQGLNGTVTGETVSSVETR